ncbi:Crp/Fnr family transcriptional regulator [Sphingobacterium phlebotomi]|uniref:Crp/Fnr family transcriptional regulator n=1 Tax=Sphingobacterium phlebotomi TaxID=2605433 RepID=A0A5D4H8V6_9SPHI|nr:Crp/Fnr family transcriptional regulator [Sphingobacterium phlebotomi]TYR36339.1 Crp/Fnr family transcriptional regulator [Sphingobacterium phlebotomi]
MPAIRKNNKGFRLLFEFWSKYHQLDASHIAWARTHVGIVPVRRGQVLHRVGEKRRMVFLVCEGLLARVDYIEFKERIKRKITSIALPHFALTSTSHLYSRTPTSGDIVALRSGIVIIIPYDAIISFKEDDPAVETLIDVLTNRKKRQLETYLRVIHSTSPFQRYLLFDRLMPEIRRVTNQNEQADFLGISRRTVQEASYFLLTGKRPKK